ncbi:MAG: 4Fe-4S binding protein [Ignavibacteriales bacterium]|nr:4Fe-4S binding protein [Ignavibacteriales bacterium]
MESESKLNFRRLATPITIFVAFWTLGTVLQIIGGGWFYFINFGYIGTSVGVGMGLYMILPPKKKERGRKLAQLLVGIYMLGFLGLILKENMQIEGFFFYLLTGFIAGAVLHYLVAKIIGPLLFHRVWCSWACWTAMVLDFLPYTRNKEGRLPEKWGYLRYVHLLLSFGVVTLLWYGLHYGVILQSVSEVYWLVIGNVLYYGIAITMAYHLKDNRAFCKYVCPIPVLQKLPSRFSLMKIAGNYDLCNDCDACVKMCPMDIRIPEYLKSGKRVLSTECTYCLICINVCAKKALRTSFGFDVGGLEILNTRKSLTQ